MQPLPLPPHLPGPVRAPALLVTRKPPTPAPASVSTPISIATSSTLPHRLGGRGAFTGAPGGGGARTAPAAVHRGRLAEGRPAAAPTGLAEAPTGPGVAPRRRPGVPPTGRKVVPTDRVSARLPEAVAALQVPRRPPAVAVARPPQAAGRPAEAAAVQAAARPPEVVAVHTASCHDLRTNESHCCKKSWAMVPSTWWQMPSKAGYSTKGYVPRVVVLDHRVVEVDRCGQPIGLVDVVEHRGAERVVCRTRSWLPS